MLMEMVLPWPGGTLRSRCRSVVTTLRAARAAGRSPWQAAGAGAFRDRETNRSPGVAENHAPIVAHDARLFHPHEQVSPCGGRRCPGKHCTGMFLKDGVL